METAECGTLLLVRRFNGPDRYIEASSLGWRRPTNALVLASARPTREIWLIAGRSS